MNADLHSLSAAYALDALDADERAEFEAHLAGCAACTQEVAEFGSVTEALGDATEQQPPPHLKDSIMAQLGNVEQDDAAGDAPVVALADRRRRFSMVQGLGAAAAVALIAIGALVITGTRGSSEFDDVVAAPDAIVTELVGEAGVIEVVWSPERDQVAVRGDRLDDLSPRERYALWAIVGGVPVPAGLFEADGGSFRSVARIADLDAEAWGITIEPDTGSDVPTSEVILFAEV